MTAKPWVLKHAPKTKEDVVGQNKVIEQLELFISDYKKQKKKAALLYGQPGCGKTSIVYALAADKNLEVIELNASDFRNKDAIGSILGAATQQQSLFFRGKIILVDEVDGVSGTKDRGAVTELIKVMKNSSFPMIMTANDPFHKKFSSLRQKVQMTELNTLAYTSIATVLKRIADKEKVDYEDSAITALARRAGGDLRGAINDLQLIAMEKGQVKEADVEDVSEREQTDTIHNALMKIFKTTDPSVALSAFDNVNEDFDKCMLWIDENLPKEYEKPEDLARAYDYLSKADVMKRRIRRWQHWRFLVYINAYLTAGVAVSKDERYKKFVKYDQTKRILKLWQANMKYQKRKAISEKIALATHSSTKDVIKNTYPYIKSIFKNNQEMSDMIADELDLDADEVAYLRK